LLTYCFITTFEKEADMKKKKITVKPYLHKRLAPVIGTSLTDGKKREHYPLYYIITYDRCNQNLRSKYGEYYHEGELKEPKPDSIIQFETRIFEQIIRHEADPVTAKYEMKGLQKRYEVYSLSVREVIDMQLKQNLQLALRRTNSPLVETMDFSKANVAAQHYLEVAQRVFKNFKQLIDQQLKDDIEAYTAYSDVYPEPVLTFDFGTVIEWVNEKHKDEFKAAIAEYPKAKQKRIVTTIDKAMQPKLNEF